MKKVGLIGAGTIGSGFVYLFQHNYDRMADFIKDEIKLNSICDLDFSKCPHDLSAYNCVNDWKKITRNPEIDIVVELIGGDEPARSIIEDALKNGKSVVTANKLVIARYGEELLNLAKEKQRFLLYEAAVGGAIPVIRALKTSLIPNNIKGIYGIVNGTTNYILTKMQDHGAPYADVLKEAQKLGYAEADPSSDVDGIDSQYKIAILASIAFQTPIELSSILVDGITRVSATDIEYCKNMNSVIKLVAIAAENEGQLELRVHPVILKDSHPLASVNGVFNAAYVVGDAVGDMMFYGQGAGSVPTASAVWSDVIDIVNQTPYTRGESKTFKIKPKEKVFSEYYIRFRVLDKPGVLAAISSVLARYDISVASAIQKGLGDDAELVVITHHIYEEDKNKALADIQDLDCIEEIASVIRVGL